MDEGLGAIGEAIVGQSASLLKERGDAGIIISEAEAYPGYQAADGFPWFCDPVGRRGLFIETVPFRGTAGDMFYIVLSKRRELVPEDLAVIFRGVGKTYDPA